MRNFMAAKKVKNPVSGQAKRHESKVGKLKGKCKIACFFRPNLHKTLTLILIVEDQGTVFFYYLWPAR
ncbi:MAG: hypothetical protein JSS82_14780 [Bacteroidetes bacterium]|nr:hypothetical protein [Bacteroidota bacterium]